MKIKNTPEIKGVPFGNKVIYRNPSKMAQLVREHSNFVCSWHEGRMNARMKLVQAIMDVYITHQDVLTTEEQMMFELYMKEEADMANFTPRIEVHQ